MMKTVDYIAVKPELMIVRDDDDVFILELDSWRVPIRLRVGMSLAAELESWSFLPQNAAAARRRSEIISRIQERESILAALTSIPPEARDRHERRMRESQRFAKLYDGVIPLSAWHRLALAKHAHFRQEYIAWGVEDAHQHWPLHTVSCAAAQSLPPLVASSVYVVNDLAVDPALIWEFEARASASGITRLHFRDDGRTLALGPTLEGERLGELPRECTQPGPSTPLHRLTAALIETEMTKIAPRISAALVGEASLTKGRIFRLDWQSMGAEEARIAFSALETTSE
ncbi:hypothetical protein [Microbacterium aurugineum]